MDQHLQGGVLSVHFGGAGAGLCFYGTCCLGSCSV